MDSLLSPPSTLFSTMTLLCLKFSVYRNLGFFLVGHALPVRMLSFLSASQLFPFPHEGLAIQAKNMCDHKLNLVPRTEQETGTREPRLGHQ